MNSDDETPKPAEPQFDAHEQTIIDSLKDAYKQINKLKKSPITREIKLDIERKSIAEKIKKQY